MSKQILIVLSEWGYWGEELVGPLEACDAEGYEVSFVTPTGKRPLAHPVSMNPGFIDPSLRRSVVSEAMAEKTRAIEASDHLHNPLNLAEWLPVRPYPSSATYLPALRPRNRRSGVPDSGRTRHRPYHRV